MPCSIYQYLKSCLHAAIKSAYPEKYPHLITIPITFSSITPDPSIDITTPYPLKISQTLELPVTTVSRPILEHLKISNDYLSNTGNDIFHKGFFNFRMSDTFLLRSVHESSIDNIIPEREPATNRLDIIHKLELLLLKNKPQHLPSLDQFITFHLPRFTVEHNAARLIALSVPDGIHSVKTLDYFKQQLLNEASNCYRKCPIQSDDYPHSTLRFLVIKALYTRIMQLISKKC